MTPQDLIAAFDTLAEAPDGVIRLRELVLRLAVRGKLVPQDPEDEPASLLLGDRAEASLDVTPFDLPDGWAWSGLSRLGEIKGGATPSKRNSAFWGGSVPWVSPKDMKRDFIGESKDSITQAAVEGSSVKLIPSGSLLMVVRGMILAHSFPTALTTADVTVNQDMKALLPFDPELSAYLLLATKGHKQDVLDLVERSTHGTCKLPTKSLFAMPLALPPLAEQKRIVARVDELMGLLDRLEAARNAREATRTALRDAALAALRDADTPEEVEVAWERIAGRMDHLFTDPADVDPLRQTVLQLAVRGRLVPQDPNDEPASVLLGRIAEEKARLVAEKKIRKSKALPPVSEDEVPFEVPEGWAWSRVGEVTTLINGDRSKNYPNKHEYVGPEGIAFINTGHIRPGGGLSLDSMNYITRAKFDSLRSGKIEEGDLVYCLRGATIGKTAFVAPFSEGAVASSLVIIRPLADGLSGYLFRALTSPHGKWEIKKYDNGSAQPNLSAASARRFLLPVPPAEQGERIVARVDELMNLLDRLEQHLVSKTTAHDAFASAAVHRLDA